MEEITYTIDDLTTYSVSVKKEIFINGELIETHRKAYINSNESIDELQNDVPDKVYNEITSFWV